MMRMTCYRLLLDEGKAGRSCSWYLVVSLTNEEKLEDEDQWIDEDYDMDISQENDEANIHIANEDPTDGAAKGDEDTGFGGDDGYGDEDHRGNVTNWTFQYR